MGAKIAGLYVNDITPKEAFEKWSFLNIPKITTEKGTGRPTKRTDVILTTSWEILKKKKKRRNNSAEKYKHSFSQITAAFILNSQTGKGLVFYL